MASKKTIKVQDIEISIFQHPDSDFISLTDIARQASDEPRFVIRNWLSTQNTINYLGAWESLHNPNFNRAGFRTFRDDFFEKPFSLTPSKWLELTAAIGMVTKAGKTGGGTFAHRDIAMNFCYWINPVFQIYLIQEFQRLKDDEAERLQLDWNLKRTLSKINYRIHTDAVKNHLVPPRLQNTRQENVFYASEADLLNLAMFGLTAKQWSETNPTIRGNLRDHASAEQLLVLANLENLNAEFIKQGLDPALRLERLNEIAIYQMQLLLDVPAARQLEMG